MNLKMSGLRNIHVESSHSADESAECSRSPQPAHVLRYDKVSRSPDEEFAYRCSRWGMPERVPHELEAIILSKRGEATVTPDGITITIEGEQYRFWHADSRVCLHQVGQKVLYVRSRNYTECIHILSNDGEYLETLPCTKTPDVFSSEARQEIKQTRRVIDQIHDGLKKTHRLTTQEAVSRHKENRKKLSALDPAIVEIQPSALSQRPADQVAAGGTNRDTVDNALEQPSAPHDRGRSLTYDRATRIGDAIQEAEGRIESARARSDRHGRVDVVNRLLKKQKQPA